MLRLLVLVAALISLVSNATGASIGIFADQACSRCDLTIPASVGWDTIYVRLSAQDLGSEYVMGASFRISGIPPTWIVTQVSGPPGLSFGSPLDPGGVKVVLPPYVGVCYALYTFVVLPIPPGDAATLSVAAAGPGGCFGPAPDCPWISVEQFELACLCVEPGVLAVNGSGDCLVSVSEQPWFHVKELYR